MSQPDLDLDKVQEFAGRMLDTMNKAALALMASVGHQTGLFDAMAGLPPAPSDTVARAAHLNERYVREWLGAMVTAGVVEYDPAEETYTLPPERAAMLTRAAGAENLASLMQWITCMASVEQRIVQSFREGGGVPYSEFERFHEIMAEANGRVFDDTLVQKTLPLVPGLIDRLRAGIDVVDVGCGAGHAVNLLAREFPASRFAGFEFSEEALELARNEAESWRLQNVEFRAVDVAHMDHEGDFDLITAFDVIHDQKAPEQVLQNIARALRPDGVFLMVDISGSSKLEENVGHPLAPFLYSISTMHCMSVSLAQKGAGLGTMWGEQTARQMLADAGFRNVAVHRIDGDIMNNYYVARLR